MTHHPSQQPYPPGDAAPPAPYDYPPAGWTPPGPPPRPRRTGWVAAAAAGVGLVAVVAVAGVIAIRTVGSDGDQRTGQPPAAQAPAGEPAPAPGGDAPPAGGGRHTFVADLCGVVDFSPVYDILPADGEPSGAEQESATESSATCVAYLAGGGSRGIVTTTLGITRAGVYEPATYEMLLEQGFSGYDTVEDVAGPWQLGRLGVGGGLVKLAVLDSNLVLAIDLSIVDTAASTEAQKAAVVQIAEGILQATAQA
jgi:hypothetical protein